MLQILHRLTVKCIKCYTSIWWYLELPSLEFKLSLSKRVFALSSTGHHNI